MWAGTFWRCGCAPRTADPLRLASCFENLALENINCPCDSSHWRVSLLTLRGPALVRRTVDIYARTMST
jgi:hypothetical protein